MRCISAAYVVMRSLQRVCHVRQLCRNESISSNFFFIFGQPHHSSFSMPNEMAIFRRENPPTRTSNAGRVGRTCCWRCNRRGVVNMVAGGQRPPPRKLWHLYRWSYTAGVRPPNATRDKVTVSVVLQRKSDQARSRTIHNHDNNNNYKLCG